MDIKQNYLTVCQKIQHAEQRANRLNQVQLLAVSKTKPIEMIEALAACGQIRFGENYLQEALTKIAIHPELEWHFIGPIQSNKTKPIAEHFAWVHSVDRLKIAQRLSDQRPSNLPPLNILLEINISEQDTKAGFSADEALSFAKEICLLPGIKLRGLMCIPQISHTEAEQRATFHKMNLLFIQLQKLLPNETIDTLSMGMSGDLEAAILEGATCVRIGTDLFGGRNPT